MKVKFYGVRGSIATAGDETRRYGGNTSCVAVQAGGETLIFDAGTGIRRLGADLGFQGVRAHLFFSHLHWDHIQGFPFFGPAFGAGNRLDVYGVASPLDPGGRAATVEMAAVTWSDGPPAPDAKGVRAALAAQMTAPNFPVGLDAMRADLRFFDVPYGERITLPAKSAPIIVRHVGVDHPNGCVAYRVEHGGQAIVYATDLEIAEGQDGGSKGSRCWDSLVELSRGADLIIFDAMYTPEEYEGQGTFSRKGWGHSTYEMGARLAERAGARALCLFHHDPGHDDAFMDRLAARARTRFSQTTIAQEGMELSL